MKEKFINSDTVLIEAPQAQNPGALSKLLSKMKSFTETAEKANLVLKDSGKLNDINKELYQKVYSQKLMLHGKVADDGTDYAMMDYVISIPHIFNSCKTDFDVIQAYWQQFYPHLASFINDYAEMQAAFNQTLAETDKIVLNQGEAIYEAKLIEAFLESKPEYQEEYTVFKRQLEEKHATARKSLQEQDSKEEA